MTLYLLWRVELNLWDTVLAFLCALPQESSLTAPPHSIWLGDILPVLHDDTSLQLGYSGPDREKLDGGKLHPIHIVCAG